MRFFGRFFGLPGRVLVDFMLLPAVKAASKIHYVGAKIIIYRAKTAFIVVNVCVCSSRGLGGKMGSNSFTS